MNLLPEDFLDGLATLSFQAHALKYPKKILLSKDHAVVSKCSSKIALVHLLEKTEKALEYRQVYIAILIKLSRPGKMKTIGLDARESEYLFQTDEILNAVRSFQNPHHILCTSYTLYIIDSVHQYSNRSIK